MTDTKRKPRAAKAASKTAQKSAPVTADPPKLAPTPPRGGAQLPLGAHPGNTGGKPGRSGRKPDEWRERLRQLTTSKATERELARVLKNGDHPAFLGAYKYATEQAYQRATQAVTFPQLDPNTLQTLPLPELLALREKANSK